MYKNIVDEIVFIARASEGAVKDDFIMSQPIFVRKEYVETFQQELKERSERMKNFERK